MVGWSLRFKKTAKKDASRMNQPGLKSKTKAILKRIEEDPYYIPPPCEKLIGDLAGLFSRRINLKHRIVYAVLPDTREIIVYRMFSHYGD